MVAITHPTFLPEPLPRTRRAVTAGTYRRRRLGALGVLGAVLVAASLASVPLAGGTGSAGIEPVAAVAVVVEPGDTVWSLAAEVAPGQDPRPIVDAIVEANGGATLVAGQRLELALP